MQYRSFLSVACSVIFFLSTVSYAEAGNFFDRLKERREKRQQQDAGPRDSIMINGVKREYLVHLPKAYDKNKQYPLVLFFHGGGSAPEPTDKLTGFYSIADKEGFIVVCPAGLNEHWNDGRGVIESDDLGFVSELIDLMIERYNVDESRVYCAGISNGGLFSQFLAVKLSDKIAAAASDVALLAENIFKNSRPARPISVMMIVSTDDPLMPWGGGETGKGRLGLGGRVVSAKDNLAYWVSANGCPADVSPAVSELDSADDGTKVIIRRFAPCAGNTEVVFYEVSGGGHTWPGGPQYRNELFIGKVCKEFNASESIWEFFKRHSLKD